MTGAGTAFCAGGELSWLAESTTMTPDQLRSRMLAVYRTWLAIRTLDAPSIAALNGGCCRSGACHGARVRLALRHTRSRLICAVHFAGIHPGMAAATFLLPEVVGLAVARR